jgi:hypothetical protein
MCGAVIGVPDTVPRDNRGVVDKIDARKGAGIENVRPESPAQLEPTHDPKVRTDQIPPALRIIVKPGLANIEPLDYQISIPGHEHPTNNRSMFRFFRGLNWPRRSHSLACKERLCALLIE